MLCTDLIILLDNTDRHIMVLLYQMDGWMDDNVCFFCETLMLNADNDNDYQYV